jgi:large subunit ribosomal protein L3
MIQGIIGKKIGMTQIFAQDGRVIPVTVIKAGPCVVVQKKEAGKKGVSLQLGFVENKRFKHVNKPTQGHFKKANVPPTRILREFLADPSGYSVGDTVKLDIFSEKEKVNIIGITKGKGFQGCVKRYGFSGGADTHGSMFHRRPGSVGSNTDPAKVIKGKRLPGHMGTRRKTIRGLEVVQIDTEKNFLLVEGSVPGFNGNYVYIMKDSFKRR